VKKIPFKVLIEKQFNNALKIDPPINGIEVDGDHFLCEDEKWIKEYEIIGVLVRLDRKLEETLKLTIIKPTNPLDPPLFKIDIDVGIDSGTIYLTENEIFSFSKFAVKYYSLFGKVLPPTSPEKWREVLRVIGSNAKVVTDPESSNPIVYAVTNFIEHATVVERLEDILTSQNPIYVHDGEVYVLGKFLEQIAEKYHTTTQKMYYHLKQYITKKSKQIRIKGNRYYVWCFDKAWFNIKKPNKEEDYE